MTDTTTPTSTPATPAPSLAEQAPILLGHVAGYVGHRTVAMGLRAGLVAALADAPEGATPDDLAARLDLDPFYVSVWCRAAVAASICDEDGDRVRLAPHMATLLLDEASPAFAGAVFQVLEQPEVFDRFEASLASGERMWWDDTSPDWIAGVARTGRPFSTRLVPGGLSLVPGLTDRLEAGCRIVDTACGSGVGVVRLAEPYPACHVVGVDGDAHSVELARERAADAGVGDRVTFVESPLEDLELDEPGGWFVISDFPFPDTVEGLRTLPGRAMSGIQFFEAQIDDQLLPRSAYDDLLTRHGFSDLGSSTITPMHAITYGRA